MVMDVEQANDKLKSFALLYHEFRVCDDKHSSARLEDEKVILGSKTEEAWDRYYKSKMDLIEILTKDA